MGTGVWRTGVWRTEVWGQKSLGTEEFGDRRVCGHEFEDTSYRNLRTGVRGQEFVDMSLENGVWGQDAAGLAALDTRIREWS